MKVKIRKTKAEQLQDIVNDYIAITGATEVDMSEVAAWAIRNGRWHPAPRSAIKQCAHELARAAREEYYTDPQGRRVRCKHAVHHEQGYFWADIKTAPPDHMKLSLQQRRKGIAGDCRQLKTDMDSYNENNEHGAYIQMSFNFTEDLHELEMPHEYPDTRPDQDDYSS